MCPASYGLSSDKTISLRPLANVNAVSAGFNLCDLVTDKGVKGNRTRAKAVLRVMGVYQTFDIDIFQS